MEWAWLIFAANIKIALPAFTAPCCGVQVTVEVKWSNNKRKHRPCPALGGYHYGGRSVTHPATVNVFS